ncbi:MAG: CHAT domain-containing protein, partial [Bacteroidia bacterium]|nr:CHAT domain-containing protein [Bacteroidia bacterium]
FLRSPGSVVSGVPYRLLWGFLDSLLPAKVKVVYFSPDGVYYRVNVATLYDAQRRRFVADRYEVRYVASSRRLLLQRRRFLTKAPVVLGNPDFLAVPDTLSAGRTRSYRLFEGGIPPLPGAEVEAKGVAQLLGVEACGGQSGYGGLCEAFAIAAGAACGDAWVFCGGWAESFIGRGAFAGAGGGVG